MPEYTIQVPIRATAYVTLEADSESEALRKVAVMDFRLSLEESVDRKIQLTWETLVPRIVGKLYGKNATRWPCRL